MNDIIKMKDISEKASKIVEEYLNRGFVFNFGTMSGSDGSIFRADLVKNGITVRVKAEEVSGEYFENPVELRVMKFNAEFRNDRMLSLWDDKAYSNELVGKFYNIRSRKGCLYTESLRLFKAICKKQNERLALRYRPYDNEVLTAIRTEKVLGKVKNHRGYKNAKAEDIKGVYKNGSRYYVRFNKDVSKTAERTLRLNEGE